MPEHGSRVTRAGSPHSIGAPLRRHSIFELLACVAMMAALAVQPALAGGGDGERGQGKGNPGAKDHAAQAPAPPAAAEVPPAAAPVPAERPAAAEEAGGKSSRGGSRGAASSARNNAVKPGGGGRRGAESPVKQSAVKQDSGKASRGGAGRVAAGDGGSGKRDRGGRRAAVSNDRGGTTSAGTATLSSSSAGAPAPVDDASSELSGRSSQELSERSSQELSGRSTEKLAEEPSKNSSRQRGRRLRSAPAGAAEEVAITPATLAEAAAQLRVAEPNLQAPAASDGAASRARSTAPRRAGSARGGLAPGGAGIAGSSAAGTLPAAPLGDLLLTPPPAAAAGLGVREVEGVTTSRPRATAAPAEPLARPSAIERALEEAAAVIPTWVWIALAALSALVLALGAHSILAAARARGLERQRSKLMEDVGLLQEALLPAVAPQMGSLLTTVAYRPADGLAAGGDFYDAFALPDGRIGLLLGDVSGHGRDALAKTALVRFTVRAHLEAGMSPREAISIAGRSLEDRLGDDFSTVIAAVHDPSEGTLTYASAGHPPPLVLGPSAHAPLTASSAPPVGLGFPTGQRQTVLPMPAGTTVALYSDGLLEARVDGMPLGGERLTAWLGELGPEATAKQLLELVVERADGVPDDLAAVVLHAAPGATAPSERIEQLKLDVLDTLGPDLDGFLQGAGIAESDRRRLGRLVSEQLAAGGAAIVELRAGEHPQARVLPLAAASAGSPRERARAR